MHNHSSSSIFIKDGIGKSFNPALYFQTKSSNRKLSAEERERSSRLRKPQLEWVHCTCRTVICITLWFSFSFCLFCFGLFFFFNQIIGLLHHTTVSVRVRRVATLCVVALFFIPIIKTWNWWPSVSETNTQQLPVAVTWTRLVGVARRGLDGVCFAANSLSNSPEGR